MTEHGQPAALSPDAMSVVNAARWNFAPQFEALARYHATEGRDAMVEAITTAAGVLGGEDRVPASVADAIVTAVFGEPGP